MNKMIICNSLSAFRLETVLGELFHGPQKHEIQCRKGWFVFYTSTSQKICQRAQHCTASLNTLTGFYYSGKLSCQQLFYFCCSNLMVNSRTIAHITMFSTRNVHLHVCDWSVQHLVRWCHVCSKSWVRFVFFAGRSCSDLHFHHKRTNKVKIKSRFYCRHKLWILNSCRDTVITAECAL